MSSSSPMVAPATHPGTIVVVGAGQAGGWAVQTLRKEGFAGRLVLIGEEEHPPHERPPLSKAVLAGRAEHASTQLMKPDAFTALALDWRPGQTVTRIDREKRRLEFADGEDLAYDKLILCTGGKARRLAIPGADASNVHVLRTIGDAMTLAPMLGPGKNIVVVGGGWIGLEVAATARTKGANVTIVEAAGRLCERSVPPEISDYLFDLHRSNGTDVILGAQVTGFVPTTNDCVAVALADGTVLEADAIVVGVGLVPNDELARHAGLECEGGIIVDARCRTSDPDILAAGDVAVSPNPWAGRRLRLESWKNAQDQGIAAARSALGLDVSYEPLPWFWSDQYDMNLQIYGMPARSHRLIARGDIASGSFLYFFVEGDVIKAALGVNAARDLRFAGRLIEQRRPVDLDRLADADVPMAKVGREASSTENRRIST